MAVAAYFHRSAVAASQVLAGYDEDAIAERLVGAPVAISVGDDALDAPEGRHLLDLTVRLLARLYPRLSITASCDVDPWRDLAVAINPDIEFDRSEPTAAITIGHGEQVAPMTIYAGSDGWDAHLSASEPLQLGSTDVPFGAGAAACLAAANMFRAVFGLGDLDAQVRFSTLSMEPGATVDPPSLPTIDLGNATALVGAGAVGQGALWALARCPLEGRLHIVDHEPLDLSNLQRYVLATPKDEGRPKVDIAVEHLPNITTIAARMSWEAFTAAHGYRWSRVLVAVDSARARRAVQASLPRWIANAWTQPGDLGISTHPWTETGACLACVYLPAGEVPNEDELIATALGLSVEVDGLEIRRLLYTGAPPPPEFLAKVAAALNQPPEVLEAYAARPLRHLYVEGICGGAVVPLSQVGRPGQDVHVPLAHQSALAGVLLSARLAADVAGLGAPSTEVTRLNVLRAVQPFPTQPAQKDSRRRCICADEDYRNTWQAKYG